MEHEGYELGMIGLGTMGRNLLLNMADHGHSVVGYDRDTDKVKALRQEGKGRAIAGAQDLAEFIAKLRKPRAVMLLVPAGAPVDAVIREIAPRLDAGDLIMDAGNSFYVDTDRRHADLGAKGIAFLGVGISGGEFGARHGPSIMPGGSPEAYARVRPLLESVAARVNNAPCVTYLGPGSAGHFVKMVHNGIEYGVMQIIAESYDLLGRGVGLRNDALHATYTRWNQGALESYLMKITSRIFAQRDARGGGDLIDQIRDVAGQKGTGMWTSQQAMQLGVPVPCIDMAVVQRNLAGAKTLRDQALDRLKVRRATFEGDRDDCVTQVRNAVYAATILTYTQGMALLFEASEAMGYQLKLEAISAIWRGGCIIRARLLEDIRDAYRTRPHLPNLLLYQPIADTVMNLRTDLAEAVALAARLAIPAPALMAALAYLDSYASERLPTNLIQAQRDFFGSHTYERVDTSGSFHTDWPRG
ncbi:NADP-dependent phosphogluconate dehydrogenase [Bradymonas sediminis]|uniref:6-phosphogluconate dehydrogenase, decarboxylating n=1 Tax=Bradymonas sediminis TaxID=1548548 RepID=A0A2Z4FIE7_9DELT|nr:NADP-dependent phosphogluconate dehydrogenase [Bradymonas sediminis]AWV88787.1 phosphogluconate dehydrogenase (NADP(+)-dependent, decarboxylating) [Bradymonas sediminis]TDP61785.1 6-phosphogluconate dehydrogenase (decarboxylating) [Bradymonas sediminis]